MPNKRCYRLIIATLDGASQVKIKDLSEDTFLMLLPKGYDDSNVMTLSADFIPPGGELTVYHIQDSKKTEELLELLRLRAASTLIHSIPPAYRKLPPPYEHLEDIHVIDRLLDDDEDAVEGYRHVITHMHGIFTKGITKSVNAEPSDTTNYGRPFLESLEAASPIWEERAKKLLIEEHKILQELLNELGTGLDFIRFHLGRLLSGGQFEKLISHAMMAAVDKSPILRSYHQIAYDVNVEHYMNGRPVEILLQQLENWAKSPRFVDNDSFRIDSQYATHTKKHPMQCLDDLGEKYFRKIIETHESGEVLYTRAVLCRSLVVIYFFQSLITLWDNCLLNGHANTVEGLVPTYPNLMERLRQTMARGSCPRESHTEIKKAGKLLDKLATEKLTPQAPLVRSSSPTRCSSLDDVEMVDANPLSEHSSGTIIQTEVNPGSRKCKKKNKRRSEKRKEERLNMKLENKVNVAQVATSVEDTAISVEPVTSAIVTPKPSQSPVDELKAGVEKKQKKVVPMSASSGPVSKAKAKKERRKARAANELALQQLEDQMFQEAKAAAALDVEIGSNGNGTPAVTRPTTPEEQIPIEEDENSDEILTPTKLRRIRRKAKKRADAAAAAAGSSPSTPKKASHSPQTSLSSSASKESPQSQEEFYDDEEAMRKAIEASKQEQVVWTLVSDKKPKSATSSRPIRRRVPVIHHGNHNAVFPEYSSPPIVRKPSPKPTATQNKQQAGPGPKLGKKPAAGVRPVGPRKDNRKSSGKNVKPKVERKVTPPPPIPVFESVEEFPILVVPKLLKAQSPLETTPAEPTTVQVECKDDALISEMLGFSPFAEPQTNREIARVAFPSDGLFEKARAGENPTIGDVSKVPATKAQMETTIEEEKPEGKEVADKEVVEVEKVTPKKERRAVVIPAADLKVILTPKKTDQKPVVTPKKDQKGVVTPKKIQRPITPVRDQREYAIVTPRKNLRPLTTPTRAKKAAKATQDQPAVAAQGSSVPEKKVATTPARKPEPSSPTKANASPAVIIRTPSPVKAESPVPTVARTPPVVVARAPSPKVATAPVVASQVPSSPSARTGTVQLTKVEMSSSTEAKAPSIAVAKAPSLIKPQPVVAKASNVVAKAPSLVKTATPSSGKPETPSPAKVETSSPASEITNKRSVLVLEDRIQFKSLTKKERRAQQAAKKAEQLAVKASSAQCQVSEDIKPAVTKAGPAEVREGASASDLPGNPAKDGNDKVVTKEEGATDVPAVQQPSGAGRSPLRPLIKKPEARKPVLNEEGQVAEEWVRRKIADNFHLFPSYGLEERFDNPPMRRDGEFVHDELMYHSYPSNMVGGIGGVDERAFMLGASPSLDCRRGEVVVPVDVKQRRVFSYYVEKPAEQGAPTEAVEIKSPHDRRYRFLSQEESGRTNKLKVKPLTDLELVYGTNPDGTFVTRGGFYTTCNRAPEKIFFVTSPRFVAGAPLKVDGSDPHCRVVVPQGSRFPVDLSNIFYQCCNLACGRRIAAELTLGCPKCGFQSTTRYCSLDCQWGDTAHFKLCGGRAMLYGNITPRCDIQRLRALKQRLVPTNSDLWRQQVAHTVSPGTYSLFMNVEEGNGGSSYQYSYQVGFAPGWEANAFGFLARLAIDHGHIGAARLMFRWVKRQIKRRAPSVWSDQTFESCVRAVADQLRAEFGPWWSEGELFWALDDTTPGGLLDLETARFMERQGWRLLWQDYPAVSWLPGLVLPPLTRPTPPPFVAGLDGFGKNPFLKGGELHPLAPLRDGYVPPGRAAASGSSQS
ncbi:hypothetical protein H072_1012 [Dactylellina haptotyla CBS 200.50]|uniref:Uncharacterized protein n=1 Tax=Dactylellina haptotyla (strain CBS 200.50) TaxID=1284197 RepID=S8CBH2_DACHA|nr:hypothetical protein H072_1012 [Dactylellina haptotyla CBS 200.50]